MVRSVFSQPVVDCAHELPSFITVETPNSPQQQLHVDHCILDRLAAFVHQRLDKTETCFSAQRNQEVFRPIVGHWQSSSEIRTNFSPCPSCFPIDDAVVLSPSWTCTSCTLDRTPDVLRANVQCPHYPHDNNLHRPSQV